MFELEPLPYAPDALEPHISRETLDYHYGKHHRAYLSGLNKLIAGTDLDNLSLEAIIRARGASLGDRPDPIFNNAAQAWNHGFYWHCLNPRSSAPDGKLSTTLIREFGSVEDFRRSFTRAALSTFGSGWTWLVGTGNGHLEIVSTANAGTPLAEGKTPLLTCDVWEHAYYIDYRNARAEYLEAFWKVANWDFLANNLRQLDEALHAA